MQRYFFEISYKGSHYSGWQRQSSVPSIQHTIEDTLTKILRKPTTIHGCGRTDAGVHASQYFFHLDIDEKHIKEELLFKLNRSLPSDIIVHALHAVSERANAQRDATKRTYHYFIHTKPDPFLSDLSYFEADDFNIDLIQKAMTFIQGKHDFRYFCKSPDKNDNCICVIGHTELHFSTDRRMIMLAYQGNRFLHHMIRLLVGNMLKVGKGTLTLDEFIAYLNTTSVPKHFDIAYPQGLYLAHIDYPFLTTPSKSVFPTLFKF